MAFSQRGLKQTMSATKPRSAFLLAWVLAGVNLRAAAPDVEIKPPPFRHVYFLFLQPPFEGCRDCYVPMLITRVPIDQAALVSGDIENVAIITYERDSIWEIRSDSVPLNRESVNLQERKIRWKDSRYRYQ